jgi:uncharacterized protein (DUF1499 family)
MDTNTTEALIKPCPLSPNCVSSLETDKGHAIDPIRFAGSSTDAQYRMLHILNGLKRTRVLSFEDNAIEAEFVSSIFGFVDEVVFLFDDRKKVIHVRSASRIGFSDLGVNRRRMERIRKLFEKGESNHEQN